MSEPRGTVPTSEIVTRTGRLSPFEDFRQRTLAAMNGLWDRFFYVADLRSSNGQYEHWGHGRVHGEASSRAALGMAHSELYLQLLRTPLQELMNDWQQENVDRLPRKYSKLMVPEALQGGSPRHFSSIVLAVRLLNAERQASTRSSA
jgi:hypothetical protein